MRGLIILFFLVAVGGVGFHGLGGGGDGVAERVIKAEPQAIVEAMNRSLQRDGMEVVSRSDSGDYYRLALTAEEMRRHPQFSQLAEQGDVTISARVTRRRMEFTATFASGLVSGYAIEMSPAPDGSGTLAKAAPVVRYTNGRERNEARFQALQSRFRTVGERTLQGIAEAAERDA